MSVFDAHLHIIDKRFPLVENQGYLPEEFSVSQYLDHVNELDVTGGAIVSGSFQAFDQSYLVSALSLLNGLNGKGRPDGIAESSRFVGVTQLPHSVSDDELAALDDVGVRAVRFNLYRGGSESLVFMESMAKRVYECFGWHVELYISAKGVVENQSLIKRLPKVSIDHLGMEKESFGVINKLLEHGVGLKATGFGRIDFDPLSRLKEVYRINPEALMFGTDLPSTRAPVPFSDKDLLMLKENFSENAYRKICCENAQRFYLGSQNA